jgi:hypothetical protein
MTIETIISSFKAASLVLFNLDEVLSDLRLIIGVLASQDDWLPSRDSIDSKTLPNIK